VATVKLEQISKSFKTKAGMLRAVDHLSLKLADCEFLVLVGPSGCGKTTTLRLIAGLEEADGGRIWIGPRDVTDMAPRDRDIAMVFQSYALYPHMTVFKNMAFGLKMRRVPKDQIRGKVDEVARMLGIQHLLDRNPASLSGGERQRVAVGRAVVRRPKVFLFDEPLSNLDARLRLHMRTDIKTLQRAVGTTMIYVTHDQEEAMTLGDRVVVMNDGAVQQRGAPLEVYNHPANRFVASFIGTETMNFLEGRLERDGAAVTFDSSIGRLRLPLEPTGDLNTFFGQSIVVGIRPEHVQLGEHVHLLDNRQSSDPTSKISASETRAAQLSVQLVEQLGDSMHVHLTTPAGEPMVARVPPTTNVSPGQRVHVRLELAQVHLFAPGECGRRLN
jgi:multiple sugar transport system ATP-binding protein